MITLAIIAFISITYGISNTFDGPTGKGLLQIVGWLASILCIALCLTFYFERKKPKNMEEYKPVEIQLYYKA